MGWKVFIPEFQYCTDNAGMIAISGHFYFEKKKFGNLFDSPLPRMTF
jgi:N6-L-threonylcarbamoyladenine synthase